MNRTTSLPSSAVSHRKKLSKYAVVTVVAPPPRPLTRVRTTPLTLFHPQLVTHQYTPLNNTYVYNGISSHGAQVEL